MMNKLRLLDVVALLADVAEQNVSRGQVGTVLEIHRDGKVLVEFSDEGGKAYAIATLTSNQVLRLQYEPEAA
jgi:hypothetical protein